MNFVAPENVHHAFLTEIVLVYPPPYHFSSPFCFTSAFLSNLFQNNIKRLADPHNPDHAPCLYGMEHAGSVGNLPCHMLSHMSVLTDFDVH